MDIGKFNIFSLKDADFDETALAIFQHQAIHNNIYKNYLHHLEKKVEEVTAVSEIPFLPIEFFKNHAVKTDEFDAATIFTSSGTSGNQTSRHFVKELNHYKNSFTKAFQLFYGNPQKYCILALLPSYLEREGSSLVYMMQDLIDQSQHPESGFYLHEHEKLAAVLHQLEQMEQPTILIGVSFALLDFVEKYQMQLKHTIIMETGGMKGRREEMIREELHLKLKNGFGVEKIHSEYGMTELLSQSYSQGNGIFYSPPWMRVYIRDLYDPFEFMTDGRSGAVNIIDLANIHSCAFIQTSDLGRKHADGSFELLGRSDNSDIRGCNLLL